MYIDIDPKEEKKMEKINKFSDCSIFLFVNSGSGGGLGAKIIKQEVKQHLYLGCSDCIQYSNKKLKRCQKH